MITHILLILTIVTAPGQDDIVKKVDVPTIEECWRQAGEFVNRAPPEVDGVQGLMAGCAVFSDGEGP
jgi:hypothetical protein